jgi:hypothetical protein
MPECFGQTQMTKDPGKWRSMARRSTLSWPVQAEGGRGIGTAEAGRGIGTAEAGSAPLQPPVVLLGWGEGQGLGIGRKLQGWCCQESSHGDVLPDGARLPNPRPVAVHVLRIEHAPLGHDSSRAVPLQMTLFNYCAMPTETIWNLKVVDASRISRSSSTCPSGQWRRGGSPRRLVQSFRGLTRRGSPIRCLTSRPPPGRSLWVVLPPAGPRFASAGGQWPEPGSGV